MCLAISLIIILIITVIILCWKLDGKDEALKLQQHKLRETANCVEKLERELDSLQYGAVIRGFARYDVTHKPISKTGVGECVAYQEFEWVKQAEIIKNILESRKKK